MSIFRNTRRITEQAIQKKLFAPPPRICYGIANRNQKNKRSTKQEALQNNQLIIEEVGYKRFSIVRKNISPQHIAKPSVNNPYHIANNQVTPRIYYEIANKNKHLLEKEDSVHRLYQLRRNEIKLVPKKNASQQHLPDKDVSKPVVYEMIPHNHIVAPNKGAWSKELRDNRNQIIYHRVFTVADVNRENYVKPFKNVLWFAKKKDENEGAIKHSSGRVGKLSSGNESEYFFKTDRERLMELKKKMKDKEQGPDAPKKS